MVGYNADEMTALAPFAPTSAEAYIEATRRQYGALTDDFLKIYPVRGRRHAGGALRERARLVDRVGGALLGEGGDRVMRKEGEAAAFEVQFGNISEFKASFDRLAKSGAQLCFLVTSSRAHTMRLEEARGQLLRNFEIKKQKYVLIDIETGRHLRVNFEWDSFEQKLSSHADGGGDGGQGGGAPIFREQRRKKIYGRRGEHKEQD